MRCRVIDCSLIAMSVRWKIEIDGIVRRALNRITPDSSRHRTLTETDKRTDEATEAEQQARELSDETRSFAWKTMSSARND